jgi:tetratricopeptide (TPR) repeat protein
MPADNLEKLVEQVKELIQIPSLCQSPLSVREISLLYVEGRLSYAKKDYVKAEVYFKQLTLNSPLINYFWEGYASSLQMQEKWMEAISAWRALSLLNPENSSCYIYIAECFLFLNEMEAAKIALKHVDFSKIENNQIYFVG